MPPPPPPRPPPNPPPPPPSAETANSHLLRAFAEFLDSLLQFIFVARAKILCASLHTADAHGLRRSFCSRAIERKGGQISRGWVLRHSCRGARFPATQSFLGGVHRQALETSNGSRTRGAALIGLLLLPRRKNQFKLGFSGWIFRIQHHFLSLLRESHEFGLHDISSAGQAGKDKTSIGNRCGRVLLAGQGICSRYRHAGERCLAAANGASDLVRRRPRSRRIFLRAQTFTDIGHQTKKDQSPNKRSQLGGSGGFCGGLFPLGGFDPGPPVMPMSCMRFHCSGPITITVFG